jgi:hypothetical protein
MKVTVEMSDVRACDASSCAYNVEEHCHAQAITIGDGVHPACDTFFVSASHVRETGRDAGVGACKISGCRYNEDLECAADAIHVAMHDSHADCMTFAPR